MRGMTGLNEISRKVLAPTHMITHRKLAPLSNIPHPNIFEALLSNTDFSGMTSFDNFQRIFKPMEARLWRCIKMDFQNLCL